MIDSVSFIVIAHYNALTLSHCLSSAEAQCEINDELILVLNNPDAQTKSAALKHDRWVVIYESLPGSQFARNAGAKVATKRILCFLDADVVLPPKWRGVMLSNFNDPWVAIGQSQISRIKSQGLFDWIVRYQHLKFNSRFYFMGGSSSKEVSLSLDTAAMMVRKEWFNRVSGFDRDLSRLEDTDFSLRVLYYGGDLFFEDRTSAFEMYDPSDGFLNLLRNYVKSIKLSPLLNSKHFIDFSFSFFPPGRVDGSRLKKIPLIGRSWDLLLNCLEFVGLALSPYPLFIIQTKFFEYKANPKKAEMIENLDPNLRVIWVGRKKRSYDLRMRKYSKDKG